MECPCLPGFERDAPSDWLSQCVEKGEKYACGKGKGEGFIKLPSVKLPDARTAKLFPNLSLRECETECLKSCNCTGYASSDISPGGIGYFAWYGELNDTRTYINGQDFHIRVDAKELAYSRKNSQGSSRMKSIVIIVAVLARFAMLVLISCCPYLWRKHSKRRGLIKNRRYQEMLLQGSATTWSNKNSPTANSHEEGRSLDLIFFDLNTIKAATENFSPTKKLGEGGFGPVFKGELRNRQQIAVKKLSKQSGQGINELKNEALLIAKLQHRNLVRLLDCCIEDQEKMMIYEYMPNKSLDYFIFDESRRSLRNWKKSHEIISGVARTPKISDFGTAKIFGGNQSEANTNRVVGTLHGSYGIMVAFWR